MSDTPTNGIPYVPENTTDPAAGLNLALDVIDALLSTRVESMALSAPPGSPADGQMWVVKSPGTGAWAGHNNAFARYIAASTSWLFYEAGAQAWLCLNKADGGLYHWGGSAWAQASGLSDAPTDGTTYGRNNGAWVAVSGGSGDVQSVNGVGPDSSGDIELPAADIPFDGASSSGLSSTNVEDALNELGARPSGGGGAAIGTYASRPSESDGSTYHCTDCPLTLIGAGGIWTPWNQQEQMTLPPSFPSWVNQGTASVANSGPFPRIHVPAVTGTQLRIISKALAHTSNFTVTALLKFNALGAQFGQGGLVVFNSAGNPIVGMALTNRGTGNPVTRTVDINRWTNFTTYNSSQASSSYGGSDRIYMRYIDDGTNRYWSYSIDAISWIQLYQESRAATLTADSIGIYGDTENTVLPLDVMVLSFKET